jgi:hypothetical protein
MKPDLGSDVTPDVNAGSESTVSPSGSARLSLETLPNLGKG